MLSLLGTRDAMTHLIFNTKLSDIWHGCTGWLKGDLVGYRLSTKKKSKSLRQFPPFGGSSGVGCRMPFSSLCVGNMHGRVLCNNNYRIML